jgi:hypothetical protein
MTGFGWLVSTEALGRPKTFSLLTVVHIDELPWHSTILRRRGLRVAGRRRGPINEVPQLSSSCSSPVS